MPLYTPTACLSASYEQQFGGQVVQTYAPARAIHQALYDDENLFRRIYAENTSPSASKKKNLDESCNIATAQITLLYSEIDAEEGLPAHLRKLEHYVQYTADQYHVSQSMLNLYTKHEDKLNPVGTYMTFETFSQQVLHRLAQAKLAVPLDTLHDHEKKFKQTPEKVLLKDFSQAFHHSEQSLMSALLSASNINALVMALQTVNAATFGGILLDMYSTRYMCNNCNYQLIGFSNDHYMPKLTEAIANAELRMNYPVTKPIMHTRVSAEYPTTTNNGKLILNSQDRLTYHQYHANESTYLPLQTSVKQLRLTAYRGGDFATRSDFFLSGDLRNDAVDKHIIHQRTARLR